MGGHLLFLSEALREAVCGSESILEAAGFYC